MTVILLGKKILVLPNECVLFGFDVEFSVSMSRLEPAQKAGRPPGTQIDKKKAKK